MPLFLLLGCSSEDPRLADTYDLGDAGYSNDQYADAHSESDPNPSLMPSTTGLPCAVESLLKTRCQSCHGTTRTNAAPISLVTYADLTALDDGDPNKPFAKLSVMRMKDLAAPMPPSAPFATDSEIAAMQAWIDAGMPMRTCVAGQDLPAGSVTPSGDGGVTPSPDAGTVTDGGVPTDGSVIADAGSDGSPTPIDAAPAPDGGTGGGGTCTSGWTWTGGDHGSSLMRPGTVCMACHVNDDDAPRFKISGTVYSMLNEPNDCFGRSGGKVVIIDAKGNTFNLSINDAGNFYYKGSDSIAKPYYAKVVVDGRERAMIAAQTSGDCNSCHSATGANGAPGRIIAP